MRLKYKKIILLLTMGIMGIGMVVMPIELPSSQGNNLLKAASVDVIKHTSTNLPTPGITMTNAPTPTNTPTPVPEDPLKLKLNKYPKINELIEAYYTAKLERDEDTLKNSVTDPSVIDINVIHRKVEYINDYHNINCYTKPGIKDGDFVVYVTYDMEIVNIETYAPCVDELYVTTVDGKYLLYMGQVTEEVKALMKSYHNVEDVIELAAYVDNMMLEAIRSDESLYQFYVNLTGQELAPNPTPEAGNEE